MSPQPPPGFRRAWQHRRWRWLWGSYAISTTGDFVYSVATIVFLIEATDSPSWVAASVIARMVAYIVLAPFAGVVADRYDRRRLLVALDLTRTALMMVLALIAWADAPPALVIAVMVLSSAASAPDRPAAVAATPLLVPEDDLAAANAAESIATQLGYFVGPALGAGLIAATGTAAAFAVNGLTFAVSALMLVNLGDIGGGRSSRPASTDVSEGETTGPDEDVEADDGSFRAGVTVVRTEQGLGLLVLFIAVSVLVMGFEEVAHVLVATDRLDMGPSGVGVMAAATAIGGLIVAPFTARLAAGRSLGSIMVISGVLSGLPVALLAITSNPVLAMVILGVEGVGIIVFEVLSMTLLQRACDERVLGRVYGLIDGAAAGGQLLGSLSAPILLGVLSLEAGLWIIGLTMVGTSLLAGPSMLMMAGRTDTDRSSLAPMVARLRSLDVFAEIPQAGLERLARQVTHIEAAAGTTVITEGGPSDDVYIVESGELLVRTERDGEVNRMGPDDVFGEIGLVRHIPRTASVDTVTDTELLVLPGGDFLDAVTATGPLPDPLRRTVSLRLGRTHPWLVD